MPVPTVDNMIALGRIAQRPKQSKIEELRSALTSAIDTHGGRVDFEASCPVVLANVKHDEGFVTLDCSAAMLASGYIESINELYAASGDEQVGKKVLVLVKTHTSRASAIVVDLTDYADEPTAGWIVCDFEDNARVTKSNSFVWNGNREAFVDDALVAGSVLLVVNLRKKRTRPGIAAGEGQQASPEQAEVTVQQENALSEPPKRLRGEGKIPIAQVITAYKKMYDPEPPKRFRGERKIPIVQAVASYKKMHEEMLALHRSPGSAAEITMSVPEKSFQQYGTPDQLSEEVATGSRSAEEWTLLLGTWKDAAVAHVFDITLTNMQSEFPRMLMTQELLAPPCLRNITMGEPPNPEQLSPAQQKRNNRNAAYVRLCLRYTESFGVGVTAPSKARGQIYKPARAGNAGVRLGGKAAPAWDSIQASMDQSDRMLLPSDKFLSKRMLVVVDTIEALAENQTPVAELCKRWREFVEADPDLSLITNRYEFDW